MKKFVFSIDVEDWFQVENLKGIVEYDDWHVEELRISESTEIVLDILRTYNVKATFFILGWIAERRPDLVIHIANQGHEIASHGYKHELLHTMDENSIEADIRRSLEILQPLSRNKVIGYRAPSFSITKAAANVLKRMNFEYDASLNDFQFNRRYGKLTTFNKESGMDSNIVKYSVLDNGLIEFPISVNTYFNIYWPLGGGYCRLSPMWFLKKQLNDVIRKGDIVSIYLHPWEFDPGQPRLKKLGMNYYFRHYYGLDKTAEKVEKLIKITKESPDVELKTFGEIVESLDHID
jgi:polysaccharide deacetylase family protein (PEP-CTERM system associated)